MDGFEILTNAVLELLSQFPGLNGREILFEELGKEDPMFARLHALVQKHGGLWNAEAEAYLLGNCPKL